MFGSNMLPLSPFSALSFWSVFNASGLDAPSEFMFTPGAVGALPGPLGRSPGWKPFDSVQQVPSKSATDAARV